MRRKFTPLFLLLFALQANVFAQLDCGFTYNPTTGCAPQTVQFTAALNGPGITHSWDFDNGNTATQANPTSSYPTSGIFNVRHIVSNGSTSDTCYEQVRIFVPASPDFTSTNPDGCVQPCFNVSFTNLSIPGESPIVEAVWDFGDGGLPVSSYNSQHCYTTPGIYSVTLVVRDSNGCQTSITEPNYVHIGQGPTATITSVNPTQSCTSPQLVSFQGSGTAVNPGTISYSWQFGNGGTSNSQNPSQSYSNGIYDPILTVTDGLGCIARDTAHVEITNVIAGFTAASTNACSGVALQFTDTSNFASSWSWNFGDGGTSNLQNPTHTYATNGTYTVSLTVTYNGCTDTETQLNYITVSTPVSVDFTAPDTADCSAPFTVNFTSNAPGATSYSWNFGDGGTSTSANPSHTYNSAGSFTVSLSVTNASGCVNTFTRTNYVVIGGLNASFTLDSNQGCSPLLVHFTSNVTSNAPVTGYSWNFGDGGVSSVANPVHVYMATGQYTPVLTVQNSNGCIDSFVYAGTIDVGQTLVPDFIANPLTVCVDQTVTFTNNTAGVGAQTTYIWDFGDGQTSTLANPTHTYSDTGHFDITLTVINQGCSATLVKLKYIQVLVPRADFVFQFDCSNPTTVAFVDTSIGADTWFWDFGDGTSSTQQSPVHTFPGQNSYTITLVVSNTLTGCVDSTKKQLPIGTPNAGFVADTTNGCLYLTVHFSDTSTFASSWLWTFGDSFSSTQQSPTHTFTDTGKYTIQLIINPGQQCSDTITKVQYITVYGIKLNPTANPASGCAPLIVQFRDSSSSYLGSINYWNWVFAPGDTAFTPTAVDTFAAGVTNIKFYVRDTHGCSASTNFNINSRQSLPSFTVDTIACPGESIHFTNTSTGIGLIPNVYLWDFGDGGTSNLPNPNHTYLQSGSYGVTLIAQNSSVGCPDTLFIPNAIAVDTPNADFYVTSNFAPCPPFPVQFYNSTNRTDLNWLWLFGDGDTSTAYEPLHVYFFPGDYDVTLIAWDSSGCVDTTTYVDMIRVRGPIGNFVATPDSGCVPLTVSISGSVQSTVSIVADLGDGVSFQDTVNLVHTYQNVGNYYPVYTLTDSVGCVVAYPVDTIVVGLIPYPQLNDTTVCEGNYVQFNLTLGDYFQWDASLANKYLNCDTCPNPIASTPDTITYYVTATTNLGCVARDTVTINVDKLPPIFPGISFRICPGDTLQLNAGPGVTAATWEPDQYINDTTIVNPVVYPPDSMIYRVTGYNQSGCSISRIVKVWTITDVVADILEDTILQCVGEPIDLHAQVLEASANDTTVHWIPVSFLNDPNIYNPTLAAPPGIYDYRVVVSSSTCKPDTDVVHITIGPTPVVEAGDDQTVAEGTTVQIYAASPDDVSYFWLPTFDSLSCTECRRPYVTATATQTIYINVVNGYGCKALDSVEIRVVGCNADWIYIPNTFTPNGDGLNDRLFVRGIGLRKLEYFRVFDRWGHLVYDSKDINEGWDGTVNGKAAEVATYVFVAKGECTSGSVIEKQGNVTLIR